MQHLDELEAESVFILREAFAKLDKLAILWSLGKDSNVVLWLCRKACSASTGLRPASGVTVRATWRQSAISASDSNLPRRRGIASALPPARP